jgi:hypothetical protein
MHPPHNHHFDLSNDSGSSVDSSELVARMGASMAAHPVGWVVGAIAVLGFGAYLLFKD